MKKKILFIQPTMYDDKGRLVKKRKLHFIGLAYPILAALLPDDWEAEIIIETLEDIPYDTDASVIGIGGMGHAAKRGIEIGQEFKKMGKIVLAGGMMASLSPELIEGLCDSVIIGDAEGVFHQVIKDIENGTLKPRYHQPLEKLSYPLPRYDLLKGKRLGDFLPVNAGRGCTNRCTFCSIFGVYKGNYIKREIPEVIRDIKYIKSLGYKKFLLIDDNIVSEPEYMKKLLTEVKELNMKWMSQCAITIAQDDELLQLAAESGCITLSFGLESINPESLKHVNKEWANPDDYLSIIKKVTDAGIDIASEMIVGIDTDTRESLLSTIEFIDKAKIMAPKFYILTPVPGTEMYKEYIKNNRLITLDTSKLTPAKAMITHPTMTTDEITETFWQIYNKLYTYKRMLRRTIFTKRFFKMPGRHIFYFVINLYYRYQIKRKIAPNIL